MIFKYGRNCQFWPITIHNPRDCCQHAKMEVYHEHVGEKQHDYEHLKNGHTSGFPPNDPDFYTPLNFPGSARSRYSYFASPPLKWLRSPPPPKKEGSAAPGC